MVSGLFSGLPGERAAKVSKPSTASDEEVEDALADLPEVPDEGDEGLQAHEPTEHHLRKRVRHVSEEPADNDEEEELEALEPPQLRRRPRHNDEEDEPSRTVRPVAASLEPNPSSKPTQPGVTVQTQQDDQVAAALKRLASHLGNPSKFPKASPLFRQLIDSGTLEKQHRALVFAAIQTVFSLQPDRHKHLVDPLNRREVIKLMASVEGLCTGNYLNKAERSQVTDVYKPLGVICNEMLTDDSFVFSKVISKLKALVDQLPSEGDGYDYEDETAAYTYVINGNIGPRPGTAPAQKTEDAGPSDPTHTVHHEQQHVPVMRSQPSGPPAPPQPAPAKRTAAVPDPDDPFGLGAIIDDDPFGLGELMGDKAPEPKVAPKPKPPKVPEPPSTAWGPSELLGARRRAVLMCVQHAKTFHKHTWAQSSIELLVEHCWQNKARFSHAQHAELDELWVWVRQARAARKLGPTAKEINRDSTSFERARADWSKVAVSARGKLGSQGDAKSNNWLG